MLKQQFLGYINEHQLVGPADRVLLAVSGGLDSMVLADLFHHIQHPFAIAHVNFGLRGAESDEDARFVQNRAEAYGVPFYQTRFDTATIAASRGISIQMAARELRYDWFASLLRAHGYAAVASAHHQNDVLETVLLNLTRGTGLAGLHGILPRQGAIIRPLLFATRDDLLAYATEHGLTYREDSSNADNKYARNRIRHQVVPTLMGLNPNLLHETLPRTLARLRAAETLVRDELARSWQTVAQVKENSVWIPAEKLLSLTEPAFRLAEWLKPHGFGEEQVALMLASLARPVGQVFTSATHRVTHERTGLLLEPLPPLADYEITLIDWPAEPVVIPRLGRLHFELFDKPADFRPPSDPTVACFDADCLTFPLIIRPWQLGDRFRPLGMSGTKLVSDLLNDLKLTRTEREQTAVLLSANEIAWVIRRRMGHSFRVTAGTGRVVGLRNSTI